MFPLFFSSNLMCILPIDKTRYTYLPWSFRFILFISRRQFLEIDLEGMKPQDFGDYFLVIQNGDGLEERVKGLTVLCK